MQLLAQHNGVALSHTKYITHLKARAGNTIKFPGCASHEEIRWQIGTQLYIERRYTRFHTSRLPHITTQSRQTLWQKY